MKNKTLLWIWLGLYILTVIFGCIPATNGILQVFQFVLAVLFFVKVATAYMDYRKHGQFEWAPPAILRATLIFSLTCPLYIWNILGM